MNDNDSHDGGTRFEDKANVIDLASMRKARSEGDSGTILNKIEAKEATFDFHLFNGETEGAEVVRARGYMKFGPQFLAVVEGPEDGSQVVFACQTPLVRYIQRVEDDTTQSTLDLG